MIDRREALRRTALIMGGTLSAPAVLGILQGCSTRPSIDWKPSFFNEDQAVLITRLADIMIPKSDTPGAVEAGVPAFIESMVRDVFSQTDQDSFMKGLGAFNEAAEKEHGDPFIDLDEEQQHDVVISTHDAAVKANAKERPFILRVKELTMLGFFTSERGATEVLQYEAIPGKYIGCQPLSEVGRTWATS